MHVKFKYGCGPIIIGGVIALALRKCIENDSFNSYFRFSIYVFSSPEPKAQLSYCHSNIVCRFMSSTLKNNFFFNFYFLFLKGERGEGVEF
jgi:hypothetical protein